MTSAKVPEDGVTGASESTRSERYTLLWSKDTILIVKTTPVPPPEQIEVDRRTVQGRMVPYRWTIRHGRNVVCEIGDDHVAYEESINPSYPEVLETFTFAQFRHGGAQLVFDAFGLPVLEQVRDTIDGWQNGFPADDDKYPPENAVRLRGRRKRR